MYMMYLRLLQQFLKIVYSSPILVTLLIPEIFYKFACLYSKEFYHTC